MESLELAEVVAQQSPSRIAKVGAVLIAHPTNLHPTTITGYGATNNPYPEEFVDGKWVSKPDVLHAEEACIAQAAKLGVKTLGASLYITHSPCFKCARLIWACGVKRVSFKHSWWDKEARVWLMERGVEVTHIREYSKVDD